MRHFVRALTRCNDAITKVVKIVVVIMVIAMVGAILWQIFMRLFFNAPPSWTEELALLLFSWSMLLMLAIGVRESFHVRMDLLISLLPSTSSRALQAFIDIASAGFGGYLVWSGTLYGLDMVGSTSAAIGYPIVLLYSAAPVCGFLMFIYGVELLFERRCHGERT